MLGLFTGGKLALYAIIFILICSIAGGIYWEINNLHNQVRNLTVERTQLQDKNSGLEKSIEGMRVVQGQLMRENEAAHKADQAASQHVQASRLDPRQQARLQKARQGKPSWAVHLINKNTACEFEHFGQNGSCKNGIWMPRYEVSP